MRLDKKSGRHMLLYPEKGLVLNPTGKAIVVDRRYTNPGAEPLRQFLAKW